MAGKHRKRSRVGTTVAKRGGTGLAAAALSATGLSTAVVTGTTASVAQAGLGHEARGLADRVERSLRKTVGGDTEQPS